MDLKGMRNNATMTQSCLLRKLLIFGQCFETVKPFEAFNQEKIDEETEKISNMNNRSIMIGKSWYWDNENYYKDYHCKDNIDLNKNHHKQYSKPFDLIFETSNDRSNNYNNRIGDGDDSKGEDNNVVNNDACILYDRPLSYI